MGKVTKSNPHLSKEEIRKGSRQQEDFGGCKNGWLFGMPWSIRGLPGKLLCTLDLQSNRFTIGWRKLVPRPFHVAAVKAEQEAFKKLEVDPVLLGHVLIPNPVSKKTGSTSVAVEGEYFLVWSLRRRRRMSTAEYPLLRLARWL